jgi:hypothetical protein
MLQLSLLPRLPPHPVTVAVPQMRLAAGAPAETMRYDANHGQARTVAEIVPTLLAVPPHNVMTGNRMEMRIGRRGEVVASRAKVTAVEAEETQVTIQTRSHRVTTVLVTTVNEGKTRARIRVEARARNVAAKVATPLMTALTPHCPLTLTPGHPTIVVIPDIGLLGAVNAHLCVIKRR